MMYDVDAVLISVGITTGIVLALTLFAFQVNPHIHSNNPVYNASPLFRPSGTSRPWAASWCASSAAS